MEETDAATVRPGQRYYSVRQATVISEWYLHATYEIALLDEIHQRVVAYQHSFDAFTPIYKTATVGRHLNGMYPTGSVLNQTVAVDYESSKCYWTVQSSRVG